MSLADDLQKLHELREKGAITEDEYVLAKKRLIDGEPVAFTPRVETPKAAPDASALRKFRRSPTDRWIGGVCGGLDELTDVPAWTWRILFVLTALLHGLGLIVYILLWIFVPLRPLALPAPRVVVTPPPPSPPGTTPPAP